MSSLYNQTPLTCAIINKKNDAIELLLLNGANVHTSIRKKPYRRYAKYNILTLLLLYIDVGGDDKEIIRLLLEHGSDINNCSYINIGTCYQETTPIIHAVFKNNLTAVSLMINDPNCYITNGASSISLLHIAADHSYIDMVKLLMTHPKANINITNEHRETMLHRAIYRGNDELVRWLLTQPNINITTISRYGQSLLHKAVIHKRYNIIKIILSHDLTITEQMIDHVGNVGLNYNVTCMFIAIDHKDIESIRILLQYGADVNRKSGYYGLIPLHQAIKKKSIEIVKLLIDNGADTNQADTYGHTSKELAANSPNILALLQ